MPLQTPNPKIPIEAARVVYIASQKATIFEGDAVARYGATKLTADRIIAYPEEERGVAEGHVTLIDAAGTAHADRIEFSWNAVKRFARGDRVEIRIQGMVLRARKADFTPGEWTLYDAEGTTCLRPNPVYYVTSEKVTVVPGKQAVIKEPRLSAFGKFLFEAPTQRFNLNPGVPGLRLPAPAFKPSQGFGLTWSGGILAGRNATFFYDARTFQGSKPSGLALFTKSYLPVAQATQIVAPRTDFAERFFYGYFDTVAVESPQSELEFLHARRSSLSGGFQLNGSVVDRDRQTRYTKLEAVLERGGEKSGFGILGQVRLQGLQREENGMEPRAALTASVEAPSFELGPGLRTLARFDAAGFGGETLYGWGRGMAGLTYAPSKWLRLSAAGFGSFEGGTPQFEIDPLYSKGGALLRADFAFAGTRLSILSKNDIRRGWYDTEFALNQVIGCVEATYIYRGYPQRSQIGLQLRLQPLLDLVKRRSQEANGTKPVDRTNGLGRPTRP